MVPFFKKQQLLKCHLLKHSADPVVQKLYEARAKREQQQSQSKKPVVKKTWRPCVELESLLSEAVHCKRFTADCRGAGDTRGLGFTRSKLRRDTPKTEERAQILAIIDELERKKGFFTAFAWNKTANGCTGTMCWNKTGIERQLSTSSLMFCGTSS